MTIILPNGRSIYMALKKVKCRLDRDTKIDIEINVLDLTICKRE